MEKIFSMRRSYGNPQDQTVTVEVDKFNKLVECVYALADEVRGMRSLCQSSTVIYTNKTIKEVLGIQDKLLKSIVTMACCLFIRSAISFGILTMMFSNSCRSIIILPLLRQVNPI